MCLSFRPHVTMFHFQIRSIFHHCFVHEWKLPLAHNDHLFWTIQLSQWKIWHKLFWIIHWKNNYNENIIRFEYGMSRRLGNVLTRITLNHAKWSPFYYAKRIRFKDFTFFSFLVKANEQWATKSGRIFRLYKRLSFIRNTQIWLTV